MGKLEFNSKFQQWQDVPQWPMQEKQTEIPNPEIQEDYTCIGHNPETLGVGHSVCVTVILHSQGKTGKVPR